MGDNFVSFTWIWLTFHVTVFGLFYCHLVDLCFCIEETIFICRCSRNTGMWLIKWQTGIRLKFIEVKRPTICKKRQMFACFVSDLLIWMKYIFVLPEWHVVSISSNELIDIRPSCVSVPKPLSSFVAAAGIHFIRRRKWNRLEEHKGDDENSSLW